MALDSRSDLDALADATYTTNGVGDITGAELNDGYKRLAASALIKNEAGDIGAGLAWSADALRVGVGAVTLAMLENRAQATFIGRKAGAGTGVPQEMSATEAKAILAIAASDVSGLAAVATSGSASDLGTGTLPIARIADGAVTLAKLANLAAATIIGRASGAGTGVPTALTASDLSTILGLASVATSGSASDLGTGTLPIARIADGAVTLAKLANLAAATIIGRASGAGTGVPTALSAAQVSAILGLAAVATSGDAADLTGTLAIARIADGTVTLAKLANLAQATVIGRASGAGTGVPQALTGSQVSTILGLAAVATSGDAADLTGTLAIARIADGTVTLAKLANLAAATVIGRASGAGTGVPTALSASQLSTILGLAAIATSGSASDLGSGTVPSARLNTSYTSIVNITMSGVLTISDHIEGDGVNFLDIYQGTADGSDSLGVRINGGGAIGASRGGTINVYGNENASFAGQVRLIAGTGATIQLVSDTTVSGILTAVSDLSVSGALTAPDISLTAMKGMIFGSKTYDPPSTGNNAAWQTTVTATGAKIGDFCLANFNGITTEIWQLTAIVSAANTVTVTGRNQTGGTVDLASGTLRVLVLSRP